MPDKKYCQQKNKKKAVAFTPPLVKQHKRRFLNLRSMGNEYPTIDLQPI